ncbi:MAG: HD domain-containing protein [Niabella sp.]|nr:HD domain-containing protein [Niabella sp.]
MMEQLIKQIEFIKEIDKLKYVLRRTCLLHSNRRENDAEHSWHLAMMAIILAEYANEPVNLLKVLKMVLMHDIVEIDSGDVFIYDTTQNHTNTEEELKAARRIFGMLPQAQAEALIEIWEEFEAGQTAEAKFARALDRLEPLLQNTSNDGGTWKEFDVRYDQVVMKKKVIARGSEQLWAFAEELLQQNLEKGILQK